MSDEQILTGEKLTPEDDFWMKQMQKLVGSSLGSIEAAAKQLIAMITAMEGIYAAVLAFSGIKEIPKGSVWAVVIYASPILLWLVGLYFALRVLMTQKYNFFSNSPDSSKETFQEIAEAKYKDLMTAYEIVVASFIVAGTCIGYWLFIGAAG